MKTNALSKTLVSELFPKKVIDESAETIIEIAHKTSQSERTAERWIKKMLDVGRVERVWKRGARQLIPAYRIKK